MKAMWTIGLALLSIAALPVLASAGHRHHRGHGHGGYSGGCGCGTAGVQYAPPAYAHYGQPTPAVAQAGAAGEYQSFSYSPTPEGEMYAAPMNGPAYYPPAYGGYDNYGYGGYGYSNYRYRAPAYENVVNKTLGRHDYGLGRR